MKNKMKLNKQKSHVLFVPWQSRGKKDGYNGATCGINIVKEAKYLGIIIDDDLQFVKQIEEWKNKIKVLKKKIYVLKYYNQNE